MPAGIMQDSSFLTRSSQDRVNIFYSLLSVLRGRDIRWFAVTWTNGQGCGGNAVMTSAILMSIGRLFRWSVLCLPIQMGPTPLQTKLKHRQNTLTRHWSWVMDLHSECKLSRLMFNSPGCSKIQTNKKHCFIFRLVFVKTDPSLPPVTNWIR